MENKMNELIAKASVLVEALPFIQKFRKSLVVIKCGGSIMEDPELVKSAMCDVVLLEAIGILCVVRTLIRANAYGFEILLKAFLCNPGITISVTIHIGIRATIICGFATHIVTGIDIVQYAVPILVTNCTNRCWKAAKTHTNRYIRPRIMKIVCIHAAIHIR